MSSRILLYTGKGGVGKTTIAAATGVRTAELGYKTIVISSDPAHSLSDAFERELGPEPVEITENLYAQEIDVYYSVKKYWGTLRDYVLKVFQWQKVDEILAEEIAALPGMEEGAAFLWVDKFYQEGEFDVIIIDSAPTGETLTLLSLPQVGRWWMERIFPVQRKVAKAIGPVVRAVSDVPIPSDETYDAVEDLYDKLNHIHSVLSNPDVSTIRIVLNPEKMVIQEAKRAYTYLQLYGYPVDLVIVNRVLPDMDENSKFAEYIKFQQKYLEQIFTDFHPLPVLQVPHLGKEVFGLELLRTIGNLTYAGEDPTRIYYSERPFKFYSKDGAHYLEMRLPYVDKKELSVLQYGDEIVIQVRNQRRNVFLPKFLAYYRIEEATLKDTWLTIKFVKEEKEMGD